MRVRCSPRTRSTTGWDRIHEVTRRLHNMGWVTEHRRAEPEWPRHVHDRANTEPSRRRRDVPIPDGAARPRARSRVVRRVCARDSEVSIMVSGSTAPRRISLARSSLFGGCHTAPRSAADDAPAGASRTFSSGSIRAGSAVLQRVNRLLADAAICRVCFETGEVACSETPRPLHEQFEAILEIVHGSVTVRSWTASRKRSNPRSLLQPLLATG